MLKGIILADLHFGSCDPEVFYEELEEILIKRIKKMKMLDFIIILGDSLDSKQYFASTAVKMLIKLIQTLLKETQSLGTIIDIIEGTRTHDALQTEMLSLIFNDNERLRVFTKVTATTICNELRVLYIPEEYIIDQYEYYAEYFSDDKFYDFIFGHGMVDKIWFSKQHIDSNQFSKVPVFKVDELLNKCHYCYFGHIHTPKTYGDKGRFKYVGSTTRDKFGEEENKGFYEILIDLETKEIKEDFIVNYMAPIFMTKIISIDKPYTIVELNNLLDKVIDKYIDSCAALRLIVNIDSSIDGFNTIREFIITKISQIKKIKLVISTNIPQEAIESMKDAMDEKIAINDYMFGSDMTIEDQINKFIQLNSGKNISVDEIRTYLKDTIMK